MTRGHSLDAGASTSVDLQEEGINQGQTRRVEEWPKNELRKKKTNSIAKKSDELMKKIAFIVFIVQIEEHLTKFSLSWSGQDTTCGSRTVPSEPAGW